MNYRVRIIFYRSNFTTTENESCVTKINIKATLNTYIITTKHITDVHTYYNSNTNQVKNNNKWDYFSS